MGGQGQTFVFLFRQHEDGKDELGSEDRLDEHAPHQSRARTQRSPDVEARGEHDADQETAENATRHLRYKQ